MFAGKWDPKIHTAWDTMKIDILNLEEAVRVMIIISLAIIISKTFSAGAENLSAITPIISCRCFRFPNYNNNRL